MSGWLSPLSSAMATPPTASMSSASAPLARDPSLAGALPVGISVCPLEAAHQPELLWRSARRCPSCLAYINQFCEVSDGAWKCALCGARNLCPTLTGVSAARDPELTYTVVEYAEPFAQPRQAELPNPNPNPNPHPHPHPHPHSHPHSHPHPNPNPNAGGAAARIRAARSLRCR